MSQALENLATQVYLSTPPEYSPSEPDGFRPTSDMIARAYATAFMQIAEAAGVPLGDERVKVGGQCGPGYCFDGVMCSPCYKPKPDSTNPVIFPRVAVAGK